MNLQEDIPVPALAAACLAGGLASGLTGLGGGTVITPRTGMPVDGQSRNTTAWVGNQLPGCPSCCSNTERVALHRLVRQLRHLVGRAQDLAWHRAPQRGSPRVEAQPRMDAPRPRGDHPEEPRHPLAGRAASHSGPAARRRRTPRRRCQVRARVLGRTNR